MMKKKIQIQKLRRNKNNHNRKKVKNQNIKKKRNYKKKNKRFWRKILIMWILKMDLKDLF